MANDLANTVGTKVRQAGATAQERAQIAAELGAQLSAALTGEAADSAKLIADLKKYNAVNNAQYAFESKLETLAKAKRQRIVLPEADDDRILKAAAVLKQKDVVDVILVGNAEKVAAQAAALDVDIEGIPVIDPTDPERVEKYAEKYAELRAKKGVTIEQAREKLKNLSYFATMMVYFDEADGMVSGAAHTTADTIRPALEFIKTKPGQSVVSGAFLMVLEHGVCVFADCAVNLNPTPEQLADIAIASSQTAVAFGIVPKVAMLTYATIESGSGPDIDRMREATKIAWEKAPGLALDGPLQFDAAYDKTVANLKCPGSLVGGQATVYIFPDLEAGNICYKAVQRTAGALAVGPLLQGLNKPVNDLSRGALVDDIVNTVIVTAIQAQAE
jgi:phosphate acetyltransferase